MNFACGLGGPRLCLLGGADLVAPGILVGAKLGHGMTERAAKRITLVARGPEDLAPVVDGEQFSGFRTVTLTPGPTVRVPRLGGGLLAG